jgi:diguanylate cyclase (GGDEF)-like protein
VSASARTASAADLVPLGERLRWLWLFRVVAVVTVASFGPDLHDRLLLSLPVLALGTGGYLAAQGAMQAIWALSGDRRLRLFGAVVVCDGLYLGWISYAAADAPMPLRYLSLVHLVVVALLASYRTGIRLALWHSAMALVAFHARLGNIPGVHPAGAPPAGATRDLLGFVWLFWLVVLATATFSSINERELRRRRYDLEALAGLSRRVEAAPSPPEVADVLLEQLHEDFALERIALLRVDEHVVTVNATRGRIGAPTAAYAQHPRSVIRRVATTGRTHLAAGLDDADPWLAEVLPDAGNLLLVPMSVDGRVTGVLVAEHSLGRGSRVERRVVDMVERFTAHTALALENALLLEQVRETAVTDGLTGIANRRHFDASLQRHIGRAVRTQEPLSLLLLDIDHFKRLNDTQGHQAGDDMLRQLAQVLRDHARVNDLAARYGGEEFALILPGCSADEALAIGDRLRAAVATTLEVTVTVGAATFPVHAVGDVELVRAADRALYDGKHAGRNRVVQPPVPLAATG